jgi:hypothetical protein
MRPNRGSISVPSGSFPSIGFPKQGVKTVRRGTCNQEVGDAQRVCSKGGKKKGPPHDRRSELISHTAYLFLSDDEYSLFLKR